MPSRSQRPQDGTVNGAHSRAGQEDKRFDTAGSGAVAYRVLSMATVPV
jgi:hypothetical protein